MGKLCTLLFGLTIGFFLYSKGYGARPPKELKTHDIGEVWSIVSNFGNYGDPNQKLPSYD